MFVRIAVCRNVGRNGLLHRLRRQNDIGELDVLPSTLGRCSTTGSLQAIIRDMASVFEGWGTYYDSDYTHALIGGTKVPQLKVSRS